MSGLELAWVGLAIFSFVGGLGLGVLATRSRGAGKRVRELEAELAAVRQSEEAFRESVGKHFDRTSDLFRDLTREYTSLYAHLAEGARELCPDREPELATGLSEALLRAGALEAAEPDSSETEVSGPNVSDPEEALAPSEAGSEEVLVQEGAAAEETPDPDLDPADEEPRQSAGAA